MADSAVADPPPSASRPDPFTSADFDCLPIPPLDPLFFSADADPNSNSIAVPQPFDSDLAFDFGFEGNGDFEFTFDGLDDLYLPDENESFLIPSPAENIEKINCESGSSGISGDRASDLAGYLNYPPSEFGSYRSGDQRVGAENVSNVPSPDCDTSGDREFSGGPASSHGSGNGGGSGLSEDTNPPSPCSGSFERDVSSKLAVDQEVKAEEDMCNASVAKRKKEQDDTVSETRSIKYRRSSVAAVNVNNSQCSDEDEEKRKARLMRNRESAQLSRQRKKYYQEELEEKVRSLHSTIAELNGKLSFFMAENVSLRQQLGGGGMCPPPPPGMYPPHPMAHMGYPWVPCAPYVMKPQGSQVPLVPIPRLKPQKSVSAPKAKKVETKKTEGKTKKVASVSFLGLLFFVLLFGGLVPMVNVRFGGGGDTGAGRFSYLNDRSYDHHKGRVLAVSGHMNGTYYATGRGSSGGTYSTVGSGGCGVGSDYKIMRKDRESMPNTSEPLVASLYVPRNDKLVKIDGNLIIHSIMASEKAMASHASGETKNDGITDPTTRQNLASALALPEVARANSHVYGKPTERQRALASGNGNPLKEHMKSTTADGKLQQWFREGLAGPMLSSGLCTEVFHFDVSSAKGAIIPASPVGNVTNENHRNATHAGKGRNRRFLHNLPNRLAGSNFNVSEEQARRNTKTRDLPTNKSLSSMVVSVLVDPREVGDGDVDGMVPPKSMSRIFVVVLMDSIKYVTYSCVLPRAGPHLVTT
ncbi:bZIP transcription factor 17 [Rhodamnia argentea]|uniref:BZIP transcription factor 17 n=1 Tax=Rhodamnia argentea TaxID=178133 RepID=A0A8B8NAU8_9MYRT|nr:bZIP transcription factor 17 [Rhodamnia argentea]